MCNCACRLKTITKIQDELYALNRSLLTLNDKLDKPIALKEAAHDEEEGASSISSSDTSSSSSNSGPNDAPAPVDVKIGNQVCVMIGRH